MVYNDVVSSLFHSSGLGAIRLKSDDDFVATQRIYAVSTSGTLGQFVAGVDASSAKAKGVIISLQAGGAFRTNVGAANPNASVANVTFYLYDKNNALVGTAKTIVMQPYGVIAPGGLAGYADGVPGTADLTDRGSPTVPTSRSSVRIRHRRRHERSNLHSCGRGYWRSSRTADRERLQRNHPLVIDRDFTGDHAGPAAAGRQGHLPLQRSRHHARVPARRCRRQLVVDVTVPPDAAVFERTVTLGAEGTYQYYCTITTCSTGHLEYAGNLPGRYSGLRSRAEILMT